MILHLQFEFLAECVGIQALGAASKKFDRLFRTLIRHFEPAPGIPTDKEHPEELTAHLRGACL